MSKKAVLFFLLIFLSPSISNAQVIISEIMYNLEGGDGGREWVEILNNGNEDVDLSEWRFDDESDSKHTLNIPPEKGGQGSIIIKSGEHLVLASDASVFLSENQTDSSVIDTVISLGQQDDSTYFVRIINENGSVSDEVSYQVSQGADSDGNSLQLVNGSWVASNPTPGEANFGKSIAKQNEQQDQDDTPSPISSSPPSSYEEESLIQKHITANAGKDRTVIVGADTLFRGIVFGLEDEPLKNARYVWSFGDGGKKEGVSVLHNYQYPGKYVVVMNVSSGEYSDSDRFIVKALPAEIIISLVDEEKGFVELLNKSEQELNLSWWKIRSGDNYFTFPKDTIILPNNKLTLPSKITELEPLDVKQTYLLYPNSEIFYHYNFVNRYNSDYVEPDKPVKPNLDSDYIQTSKLEEAEVEENNEGLEEYQVALANNPLKNQNKKDLSNRWTFLLGGIILLSIGSIFAVGKLNDDIDKSDKNELEPEDFEII